MKSWLMDKQFTQSQVKMISVALVLAGSLAFIGWSSMEKYWEVQQSLDFSSTLSELERRIAQLRVQYQAAQPETLQMNLAKANHLLINDFTHLAEWAQDLQEHSSRLALHMQYRILNTQPTPSLPPNIAEVRIELQVSPRNDRSGYGSYLKFLQALEESGPRMNIQEVTINGDGEKATRLIVGLSLWMKTQESVEL